MTETLLCLDAAYIQESGLAEGFTRLTAVEFDRLFAAERMWLGPRPRLEQDEAYRQLVSYVVFRHANSVLTYRRAPKGGESRLHGLLSIGVGGHVNISDVASTGGHIEILPTLQRACQRELAEELECGVMLNIETIGIIKESANAVSRVHLGVVVECQLETPHVKILDPGLSDARFVSLEELTQLTTQLETWSAALVAHLART
jgi:predicted NUDIX family phosphoesterase